MPDLCANFFTRQEVHQLVLKADGLRRQVTNPELGEALLSFLAGAANLAGVLADLPVSNHRNDKALESTDGWSSVWFDGSYCADAMRIGYAQQVLKTDGGPKTLSFATGRFRLTLGRGEAAETHVSSDKKKLRAELVRYVLSLPESVPADAKEFVLSHVFTEGHDDAACQQGPAEVDVRDGPEDGEAVG